MTRERILVVDDELPIAELCHRLLTKNGYAVRTASNGHDAMDLLRSDHYDLLITDIRMKGMSGLELIAAAKKLNESLAIVVITGHGTITTAIESLKLGSLGFVIKPFTQEELYTSIHHAMEKSRLMSENYRFRSLMPLFEISEHLHSETRLDSLVHRIVQIAAQETKADRASLMLLDRQTQALTVMAHTGFTEIIPDKLKRRVGEGVAGRVAQSGQPLLIQGGSSDNPDLTTLLDNESIVSSLSVPLFGTDPSVPTSLTTPPPVRQQILGVLNLAKVSSDNRPFSKSDLELVTILSGQASAAIEKVRLHNELHQSFIKTIQCLVGTMELKDAYTSGHSASVSRFAAVLAQEMGLPPVQVDEITIAGILHDIGKIGSSEDILLKEHRLSPEEFKIMKEHPINAVKLLEPVGLSRHTILSVRHHHEWYNGKGYPDGLRGEQIPLGSRILMVADTIDAMTSDRPYRKSLPIERMLEELRQFTGIQFDPQVVEVCRRLFERQGPAFFHRKTHLTDPT
jgi:putative nucleotidyltransferase with HDIG domain